MDALFPPPPFPPSALSSDSCDLRCRFSLCPISSRSSIHIVLKSFPLLPPSRRSLHSGPTPFPTSPPRCCSSCHDSSSKGRNRRWDEDDSKYLEAHVVEAVSLLPSQGQLFMTLENGGEVEVDYVNPPKGRLLYRSRNPTIFLKIDCETDLLLPIVVGDMAVGMLMKALHGEENVVRPNQYHLIKELVTTLNFEVRMVRVTERVADTYHARIYVGRPGEDGMHSIDARPSDAVNLAVRCKVPIFVNKDIVYSDAVKPVHAVTQSRTEVADDVQHTGNISALDRPESGTDPIAEEITLMKNMLLAVVEERYTDAARWRDELSNLRARKWQIRQF